MARALVVVLGLVLGILTGTGLVLGNPLAWFRGLPPLPADLAPTKAYRWDNYRGIEGGVAVRRWPNLLASVGSAPCSHRHRRAAGWRRRTGGPGREGVSHRRGELPLAGTAWHPRLLEHRLAR